MGRPLTDLELVTKLNGVPVRLGVITTAGASTTNASTASPFVIPGGTVLEVIADAACVITIGATASNGYTNVAMGRPMAIGVPQRFVLRDTDTTIAIMGAGATNAVVFALS